MAHSYHHAISSAKKWGGVPEDYLKVHDFFDQSKQSVADFRHRFMLHHSHGIFLAQQFFGHTIQNSGGRFVPVRLIVEQHVREDLGHIPTLGNWVRCIIPEPWMGRTGKLDMQNDQEGA
jgi:hypothetical protein